MQPLAHAAPLDLTALGVISSPLCSLTCNPGPGTSHGANGAYTNMVTVTKTSDNNSTQGFELPANTSGMVHVRVIDANRAFFVRIQAN